MDDNSDSCAIATLDRARTRCALTALQTGESGRTPLNGTLEWVMSDLVLEHKERRPVVVLTDGLEEGDQVAIYLLLAER